MRMKWLKAAVSAFFIFIGGNLFGQQRPPIDLVLLLDTSSAMSNYYTRINYYLSGSFLRDNLQLGDTFHLIAFSDKPRMEIARRIEGRGDLETIIGRMLLMYPLEPQADIPAALSFVENYAENLNSGRQRKIVVLSLGEGAASFPLLLEESRGRLAEYTISLEHVNPAALPQATPTPPAPAPVTPAPQPEPTSPVSPAPVPVTPAPRPEPTSPASPAPAPVTPAPRPEPTSPVSPAPAPVTPAPRSEPTSPVSPAPAPVTPAPQPEPAPIPAQETPPEPEPVPTAPPESPVIQQTPEPEASPAPPAVPVPPVQTPAASGRPRPVQPENRFMGLVRTLINDYGLLILGILALLILGLLIFLLARRLHQSPSRAMARAGRDGSRDRKITARADTPDRMQGAGSVKGPPPVKEPSQRVSKSPATRQAAEPLPPRRGTPYTDTGRPVRKLEYGSPFMLKLFVADQNTLIGKRNTHLVKPGFSYTVGGRNSDFLIFLVPVPYRIGDLKYETSGCTFYPRKPHYFPDIGNNPVHDCIGKTIRVVSDKGYELFIRLEQYEDPLLELNRLMLSIKIPNSTGAR